MILLLLISLWIIQHATSQELNNCAHPSNYSDFTVLLLNNSITVTGGTLTDLEVWSKDLSNGLDITQNCWIQQCLIPNDNSSVFHPYKYGIGFPYDNHSFAVQAGDGTNSSVMSSLAIFDYQLDTWNTPINPMQGIVPVAKARMSASFNQSTSTVWFFGGRTDLSSSQPTNYFNTFYNFDLSTNMWNWPTTYYSGGNRPARYGHSSNLINERLFILGGKTAVKTNNDWVVSAGDFQSVLVYDTVSHQGISMATIGNIPPARYSYSAVNGPDGRSIVVFGGQNASQNTFDPSNAIYVLDTCSLNWTQPTIQGTPPIARAGHEAVVYLNQYMIIMMGMQGFSTADNSPIYIDDMAILDMHTWTWISSIPPNMNPGKQAIPSCRFSFPVVVPDDDGGNNNNNNPDFNPSVINNNSSNTKQLAFGITFGILGFLVITSALTWFIIRIRRDTDATLNPRWILRKKHTSIPTSY